MKNNILINTFKQKLSFLGWFYIIVVSICAVFAYLISPDNSPNANDIQLALAFKKPMTEAKFFKEKIDKEIHSGFFENAIFGEEKNYHLIPLKNYSKTKDSLFIEEYFGENISLRQAAITSYAWKDLGLKNENQFTEKEFITSQKYYLGTDRYGRDMFSRMLIGARVSLFIGIFSVIISLVIGTFVGAYAGYYGGKVDKVLMWIMNVIWSLPSLLLVIALSVAIGKGFYQIFIAIGLTMWVDVARIVRGQFLSLRHKEYVESAKLFGISDFRIMFKHIMPNIYSSLIVIATSNFATAILLEAGLSFLGLGISAPVPSWGNMIKEHYSYIVFDTYYLAIIPGLAIMFLVMSVNFIGNALRDVIDIQQN